jgi:hypothetical protein
MKIYKLVRRRSDDKLYSYNSTESERIGLSKRRYIPNEWTEAHPKMLELGLGLAGFKTLQDAVDYDCPSYFTKRDLEIWECESFRIKANKASKWLESGCFASIKTFKKLLEDDEVGDLVPWPKGTVLVEKVKLLRRVEEHEYVNLIDPKWIK